MVKPHLPWKSLNPPTTHMAQKWHLKIDIRKRRFWLEAMSVSGVYMNLYGTNVFWNLSSQTPVEIEWVFFPRVICHHLNNHITTNLSNHQSQQWFWRIFCLVAVFVPIPKTMCKRYACAKCLESCNPPEKFPESQICFENTKKKK